MAKIIKVASATHTPNVANPFRTSRNSTTNPFKYSNFEGNTLQYADVFDGFEPKKINKLKLIASSVAGSMNKIKSGITEPIVRFAGRIKSGIVSAWDYAANTNISDLAAVKSFNALMSKSIELPGLSAIKGSISGIKSKISSAIGSMNENILGLGDDINEKWAMVVSRFNTRKISADTSVADLETMWKAEIEACELGGAA